MEGRVRREKGGGGPNISENEGEALKSRYLRKITFENLFFLVQEELSKDEIYVSQSGQNK